MATGPNYSGYSIPTGQQTGTSATDVANADKWKKNNYSAEDVAAWSASGGEEQIGENGRHYKLGPDGVMRYVDTGDAVPVDRGGQLDTKPLDLSHQAAQNMSATGIAEGDYTIGTLGQDAYNYVAPGVAKDAIGGGGGGGGQTYLAQSEVADPKKQAKTAYEKALEEAARASGYQGPGAITADKIASPDQLNREDYWNTAPTTYESVDASGRIGRASTVEIQPVQRAMVDGVDVNINAPRLGEAAQTGAVSVGKVATDPLADALRAEQIKSAQNIATGPSAVKPTLQAGQVESLQNALAVAAQARGAERAGARREAILASQQGGMAAALKAAALSAQEEQAKRVATTEALSGIRSQDVATANARQQIEAQRMALQAQIDSAIAQGNTEAANEFRRRQAELDVQARTAEVQAGLSQQGTMAGLATSNLGVEAARAAADAAAMNKSESDFIAAQNAEKAAAAARATEANRINIENAYKQQEENIRRAKEIEEGNIKTKVGVDSANVTNKLEADKTTATNAIDTEKTRQAGTTSALNTGNVSASTGVTAAGQVIDATKAQSTSDTADKAAKYAAAGAVAAAAMSDERVKSEINPIGSGGPALDEMEERQRRNKFNETQLRDTSSAFEALARSPNTPPTQHNRDWAEFLGRNQSGSYEDMMAEYADMKRKEGVVAYSDEATKREVDKMDSRDVQDWAAQIDPITFWYKPGYGDSGERPQIGLSANQVEDSGPLGKMMVSRDPQGVRKLNYQQAILMLSKAAFDKAAQTELALKRLSASNGGGR